MDRSRVGWIVASGPSGSLWSFALEKLVLEAWPWWAHAAAGTGCMLLALWWMSHRDRKVIPRVLREEGFLGQEEAGQVIMGSSAFQERLERDAKPELMRLQDNLEAYVDRVDAQELALDRREREAMVQMRREYIQQRGHCHLAKLELYHKDTLEEWLAELAREPEPDSSFDALPFFQGEDQID